MTYPDPDPRVATPIPVDIQNWPENKPVKPPYVKNTTVKTFVLDPAGPQNGGRWIQISDYEPNRLRMAITPIDFAVSLLDAPPTSSPDTTSSSVAPVGAFLPVATRAHEFFGPDAMWINSLGTITRVTVIKEYGA